MSAVSSDISEATDGLGSFSMIRLSELGSSFTVTFTFCGNGACSVMSETEWLISDELVTAIPGAVSAISVPKLFTT
jgi:hypothetical protein